VSQEKKPEDSEAARANQQRLAMLGSLWRKVNGEGLTSI